MMRSLYSAVSGLKTHQTKMDVIGNNIANVNTVAFKSSSVTFQDILYQTTSSASGANANTGIGGVNAKQIGLGVTTGATNVSITSAGAAETTGNPFDIRLSDSNSTNFFVVNNGTENLFTRSGSFYVDGTGNLCMTSTGYTVMGWQVDPTTGNIRKDTVSPLRIMQTQNLTSPPEATTNGICSGIIDKNDPDLSSDTGLIKTMPFYDKLGYAYQARFSIKAIDKEKGEYTVELVSILDSEKKTIFSAEDATPEEIQALFGTKNEDSVLGTYGTGALNSGFVFDNGAIRLGDATGPELTPVTTDGKVTGFEDRTDPDNPVPYTLKQVYGISEALNAKLTANPPTAEAAFDAATGALTITGDTVNYSLEFSTADGSFIGLGDNQAGSVSLNLSGVFPNGNFENISIDFSGTQNKDNGGKSTATMDSGAADKTTGKGKKLGSLTQLSIDVYGRIFGTYSNGNTEVLGQIAVAQFGNASGLEKVGDNCYTTTQNSGDFDGIGVEIAADGSKMTSGELEMSNVDLSTEFTQMIITQRGFQANSRVISTSDTLLEELVNLKR